MLKVDLTEQNYQKKVNDVFQSNCDLYNLNCTLHNKVMYQEFSFFLFKKMLHK